MVAEIDGERSGNAATRRRDKLVLPAPEGLEMTRNRPRRLCAGLFDILHLLAKLIDRGFQLQADGGQGRRSRFGAQGVDLTH